MIRTTIEKVLLVKKRGEEFIVELHRTADGKLFVVAMKDMKHKYMKGDEVKEWEYKKESIEEIDYEKLSKEVRAALSKAGL